MMLHILVIEDDPIWQIKLQLMLEEFGYTATIVGSLSQTQQLLAQRQPSLIFADINLPDGYAIDYFKEHTPNCPIIFITEIADKSFVDKVHSIPFASFFVKPFHSLTLLSAIQSSLTVFQNSPQNIATQKVLTLPIRYAKTTDVPIATICWIAVEGNYTTVKTTQKQFVQKLSFSKIKPQLDDHFVQIHKSVIVNKDFISSTNFTKNTVTINEKIFSIGRSFRKGLLEALYN